jgi:prepilin-type processing-associated H-X9-DG protein
VILTAPFYEQKSIMDMCNHKQQVEYYMTTTSAGTADDWQNPDVISINPGGGAAFRAYSAKVLRCPSDDGHQVLAANAISRANWSRGNYACNAGPASWPGSALGASPAGSPFGDPNPNGGTTGAPTLPGGGVMCIGWGSTIHGMQDGSSNTIMLTELLVGGQLGTADRRGTAFVGMPGLSVVAGHANATGPTNRPNSGRDRVADAIDAPARNLGAVTSNTTLTDIGQARSRHTGGVNVCFGDGSVRFIRDSVSIVDWYRMNSRDDGGTVSAE